mgnify:CR=1 FL=1
MKSLMIYGATGYTGRLAVEQAVASGLPVLLAGRGREALIDLAGRFDLPYRVFDLADEAAIDAAFKEVAAILNCAGPFLRTAGPLMRAALRNGVDYLDIAAELDSYRLAEVLEEEAREAGVMLLPGGGGSVAMLGCLAGHAARRVEDPQTVRVALHVSGAMSRGSAVSAAESVTTETFIRSHGRLVPRPDAERVLFDFGDGPAPCFPVTLPDLITIGRSTGAANVETFVHVSGAAFPEGDLAALPDGPNAEERASHPYQAAVEVVGCDGATARSILHTVNGYTFTPMAAAEAARRVLAGTRRAGFQTPAELFGDDFIEGFPETRLLDL